MADAVAQREAFLETMTTESDSLSRCHDDLVTVLDEVEAGPGPETVEERLDAVAHERQETLATRRPLTRSSGHDLCQYCYDEHDWTYPVLTAVTRLRERVEDAPG